VSGALDIFCHILSPAYCDAANAAAESPLHTFARAQAIPAMVNLDARFRIMDQFDDYRQVPCLASPSIEMIAGSEKSPELARIGNDTMAALAAEHPDRFPAFVAGLPLNNSETALEEAERAVDDLDAAGVQLYTNIDGKPVDHPDILPIVELMAAKKRAVWLHPIGGMTTPDYPTEKVSKFDLWWAFRWPHESSVAMGRLVFSGIFDRYPELVVITHHVGGTVPMMEGRLDSGLKLLGTRVLPGEECAIDTPLREKPINAFKRFHADTASFGSSAPIACGRAFFGIDRILFGTDMPFDPEQGPGSIRGTLTAIDALDLTAEERDAILSGNARRVLNLHGVE